MNQPFDNDIKSFIKQPFYKRKIQMKRILLSIIIVVFLAFVLLVFTPVPIVAEHDAIVEYVIVEKIYGNKTQDIYIRLKDNYCRFYINRGLDAGFELSDLKEKLLGQEVEIKYPKYWTPLDWNNQTKHISKLSVEQTVVYNELRDL